MAAIRLEQIRKVFGGAVALRRIDLDIVDGEWLVVTGPPGCGKSTLLRIVSGHDAPTAGRVLFDGRDVSGVEPEARSVEVVRALHAIDPDRPRALSPAGLRRWLHPAPPPASPFERLRTAICASAGRRPGPAAVLADEPLAGLEPGPRSAARADLQATHRRIPVTVLHATSDQSDALALGHRVAVLIDGEIAQVGPPLWVYERPATLAVASFIGDPGINLIAGTVVTHQGSAAFRASGRILARLAPGAAALEGTPVTLGIRPADVALSSNGDGLSATVEAVEPTGPAQTVRATLADGWPLTVVVPARPLLAPGMHARFRFASHRIHVFGPDGRRFLAADPPVA